MAEKIPFQKRIAKKLLSRYRLVIVNETTFEEQLYFRISRFNVIILSSLIFGIITGLAFLLFSQTPLKEFIPGKASSELNKNAIDNHYMLDSISERFRQQSVYLSRIQKVLRGDLAFEDLDSISLDEEINVEQNQSIAPNAADSLLRDIVSQEDKYNVLEDQMADALSVLLYPPAQGPISQAYDAENKHFAVDVVLQPSTPIKSIADGTVIFSEWTAETGYVIMVEHPYSLLSVYKHNASLTRTQGDIVRAGEIIAAAGNTGEYSTGSHLHFEIWSDGYPMDPIEFIDFGTETLIEETP